MSETRIPSYRCHRPSGQAVVTLDGRDLYLGRWNTRTSRTEYERLIGEWLANGRRLPTQTAQADLRICELLVAYLNFAKGYYVDNGQPGKEFIEAVALGAGDEEIGDRIHAVNDAAEKIDRGEEATGLPTLEEAIGESVVKKVAKWLNLGLRRIRLGGQADNDLSNSDEAKGVVNAILGDAAEDAWPSPAPAMSPVEDA